MSVTFLVDFRDTNDIMTLLCWLVSEELMTTGDNDGVCIGLGASLDSFKEVDEIAEKINNLLEI